jgi:hypothetical protein
MSLHTFDHRLPHQHALVVDPRIQAGADPHEIEGPAIECRAQSRADTTLPLGRADTTAPLSCSGSMNRSNGCRNATAYCADAS